VSMNIDIFWGKISYQLITGTEYSEGLPAFIFRYKHSKQIGLLGNIKSCDFSGHSPFEATLSPSACLSRFCLHTS
jgi:hypothetical protein